MEIKNLKDVGKYSYADCCSVRGVSRTVTTTCINPTMWLQVVLLPKEQSYLQSILLILETSAPLCLQKLPTNSSKHTYSCDGHTFNFLADNGFVFHVVADESTGRSVPYVFLERVKEDFMKRYGASIRNDEPHPLADDDEDDDLFGDRFSIAYNLDREFGPILKEHMQ
ncbi:hypothetical protein Bca101_045580 [Brassica carinata]